MRRLALLLAVAAVTAGSAVAAPTATTYSIRGYEYAFTQTQGRFAGLASGPGTNAAAWKTTVDHDPLGSHPTYIDGGTFQLVAHNSDSKLGTVIGTFVHHGGTVHAIDTGAGCRNQRYAVAGRLSLSGGRSGRFDAVLTHFRKRLVGHCLIYKARVTGSVSFG